MHDVPSDAQLSASAPQSHVLSAAVPRKRGRQPGLVESTRLPGSRAGRSTKLAPFATTASADEREPKGARVRRPVAGSRPPRSGRGRRAERPISARELARRAASDRRAARALAAGPTPDGVAEAPVAPRRLRVGGTESDVVTAALGQDDAAALSSAARALRLASVFPTSARFACAPQLALPLPQTAVAASRALPAGAGLPFEALEPLAALGVEFASMVAAEAGAWAATNAEAADRASRAGSDTRATAGVAAGATAGAVADSGGGGIASSAVLSVSGSDVLAALRRLGYEDIADLVSDELGSAGLARCALPPPKATDGQPAAKRRVDKAAARSTPQKVAASSADTVPAPALAPSTAAHAGGASAAAEPSIDAATAQARAPGKRGKYITKRALAEAATRLGQTN